MESFASPLRAVVIGASGAIGSAVCQALLASSKLQQLYAFSRADCPLTHPKLTAGHIDFDDEASLSRAAQSVEQDGPVQLVFVATGILHEGAALRPEKSLREVSVAALEQVYHINAVGPLMALKAFAPLLPRKQRCIFAALSARVGSIEDNRLGGWYAYRASKAALNMLLKTASIELARTHPHAILTGLHPGTVASSLSQPFQRNVSQGKLFAPEFSAERLLAVLDQLQPEDSGSSFDWQGQRIPF